MPEPSPDEIAIEAKLAGHANAKPSPASRRAQATHALYGAGLAQLEADRIAADLSLRAGALPSCPRERQEWKQVVAADATAHWRASYEATGYHPPWQVDQVVYKASRNALAQASYEEKEGQRIAAEEKARLEQLQAEEGQREAGRLLWGEAALALGRTPDQARYLYRTLGNAQAAAQRAAAEREARVGAERRRVARIMLALAAGGTTGAYAGSKLGKGGCFSLGAFLVAALGVGIVAWVAAPMLMSNPAATSRGVSLGRTIGGLL